MRFQAICFTIALVLGFGSPALARRSATSSPVTNLPQQARAIPIPTHPAQPAKVIHRVLPKYPPEAKKKGIEGTVRLRAVIGKDGHVERLKAVSGPPILVKAAEAAVRQWVYEPTLLNGKPVEVETIVTVVFTLSKHEKGKGNHA